MLAHELVHALAIDVLSRELRHDHLHDPAHVLGRRRAGFSDRSCNCCVDHHGIGCGGQVSFEDDDFGGLLVGEILAAAFRELLDRVPSLLDERGDNLPRLGVIEVVLLLDALVHERRFEHPERAEPYRLALTHRLGDRGADLVHQRHQLSFGPRRGCGPGCGPCGTIWPGCVAAGAAIMPGAATAPKGFPAGWAPGVAGCAPGGTACGICCSFCGGMGPTRPGPGGWVLPGRRGLACGMLLKIGDSAGGIDGPFGPSSSPCGMMPFSCPNGAGCGAAAAETAGRGEAAVGSTMI